jgi:hypothetical protein
LREGLFGENMPAFKSIDLTVGIPIAGAGMLVAIVGAVLFINKRRQVPLLKQENPFPHYMSIATQ